MVIIKKYTGEQKTLWDKFVENSKNGTFMFMRDYMDYHANRFVDHSIMIYDKEKIIALLPANLVGNILYSHQGLTYGGLITDSSMKAALMLECFDSLIEFLNKEEIATLIYKRVPHIYEKYHSEEDLYALFRKDAKLVQRNISSCIYLDEKIAFNTLRKRMVKKGIKANLSVVKESTTKNIYPILEENLRTKHNNKPVHNEDEINLLISRFPENIKIFVTKDRNQKTLAGVIVYETHHTVHIQYICSIEEGRNMGALDVIFHELINNSYKDKAHFDFGISTENKGQILNDGLISQKEMFGGRGVCYDTYEIKIS